MTRGQRAAHTIVFRFLAVALALSLGFALWRRHIVAETEAAPLGHTPTHEVASP